LGELARAFVAFLWTPDAQRLFALHGLRPVVPEVAAELQDRFPAVADLFTIRDLGGWATMQRVVFASGGVYDQALARSRGARP
jgi:sulfate transport system substrate-binding protein